MCITMNCNGSPSVLPELCIAFAEAGTCIPSEDLEKRFGFSQLIFKPNTRLPFIFFCRTQFQYELIIHNLIAPQTSSFCHNLLSTQLQLGIFYLIALPIDRRIVDGFSERLYSVFVESYIFSYYAFKIIWTKRAIQGIDVIQRTQTERSGIFVFHLIKITNFIRKVMKGLQLVLY